MSNIQAVFIDRDGTIGGVKDIVIYPGDFELFPFVKDSLSELKKSEILICSFTNQPGISRGEVKLGEFISELTSFGFDKVYICPHEQGSDCNCRKPSTGMLLQAAAENNLDLSRCVVIGDRWTDLIAANDVGSTKVLVTTGAGEKDLSNYYNGVYFGKWLEAYPDYIAKNFKEAVEWILKNRSEDGDIL